MRRVISRVCARVWQSRATRCARLSLAGVFDGRSSQRAKAAQDSASILRLLTCGCARRALNAARALPRVDPSKRGLLRLAGLRGGTNDQVFVLYYGWVPHMATSSFIRSRDDGRTVQGILHRDTAAGGSPRPVAQRYRNMTAGIAIAQEGPGLCVTPPRARCASAAVYKFYLHHFIITASGTG